MTASPLRQAGLPFDLSPSPTVEAFDAGAVTGPLAGVPPSALGLPPVAPVGSVAPVGPVASVAPVAYVRHPRAKRYLIRVRRDGSVRATIPRGGSKREAVRFVEAQRQWIADQQAAAVQRRAARPTRPVGELSKLKKQARLELTARLLELAQQFGLTVNKVSIRNQRWRWGSCSQQAHICLNWRLVSMPVWVRDYVLIHELMHLRRMDHSPAFWKLIAAACPDYRVARRWLREHGQGLSED
jgi:predicted metal-dependent hydrolase